MRMTRLRLGVTALLLATLAPLACSDATDVELLEIGSAGVVAGQVFLDLDGSGGPTGADEPMEGIDVQVVTSGGDVVADATTDSLGVFVIEDVPVGSYELTLDPLALGDSLDVLGLANSITVAPGETVQYNLGATFPVLTMEEALAAPLGQQVFTSGIALNTRVNFDPEGRVHFKGAAEYLRALNVERAPIVPGDSVRLRGRVVSDNGRPALQDVTPFLLVQQAILVTPVEVTVAEAASADGGGLDAALVRIRDVEITDTSTNASGHFRFWAWRGADSVEVVVRDYLGANTSVIRPDTVVRLDGLVGLLSPFDAGAGEIRWQVLPRAGSDMILEVKAADISVALTADTTEASLGDVVEFQVVAGNAGPVAARGVEVRDTVPTAFTFLSSTATVGSYDSGTGIWDVGDMDVDASDTLWIQMELTDDGPTSVTNIAESLGLTFEVDPTAGNDAASVTVTVN